MATLSLLGRAVPPGWRPAAALVPGIVALALGLSAAGLGSSPAPAPGRGDVSPPGPAVAPAPEPADLASPAAPCRACHLLPAGAPDTAGVRTDLGPDHRPFRHVPHRDLSCRGCHGSGAEHRAPRTWTAADCASCHHAPESGPACATCHETADYAAPRTTHTTFALSVWEGPRDRELTFAHGLHEGTECRSCHEGGVAVEPMACAGCHSEHMPESDCARCHRAPSPEVHPLEAHVGCGGSACHSEEATARPMLSRPFCLVCHEAQTEHKPDRPCVLCHFMPPPATGRPS